jgi:hypothetical protein
MYKKVCGYTIIRYHSGISMCYIASQNYVRHRHNQISPPSNTID